MINRNNYKDFMIVGSDGRIMYSNFSNLHFMGLEGEELKNKKLKDVFVNIDDEYPAIAAAQRGIPNSGFRVTVSTKKRESINKVGYTYPIYKGNKPVAAIEFSDILYDREHIRDIENIHDDFLFRQNKTKYTVDSIVTNDDTMKKIKRRIEKIALTESSVLIYGETGTGKELAAQAIHNSSRRFNKLFTSVNCGTIPVNLTESLLFGTVKGSFTDSDNKPGFFEQAEGGTLFLDEINSLTPQTQMKLLRAIEDKTVRRIGDIKERKINVRIIAATNENPSDLIVQNRMKRDFYYRISASFINLPALIERGDDVMVLTDYFIRYFNDLMNTNISICDEKIKELFRNYSWPGNVRELRNVIEGAFAFATDDKIKISDIPQYIVEDAEMKKKTGRRSFDNGETLKEKLDDIENELISEAIRHSDFNLAQAAGRLGISRQLLNYKMCKHKTNGR